MKKIETFRKIKSSADGLSLMILFTFMWTAIAEFASVSWLYRSFGLIYLIMIAYFTFTYLRFNEIVKLIPKKAYFEETPENLKSNKKFIIIFVAEGILILVARNILVNLEMGDFFLPCFSLIVGLHFLPLGKLFNRKIDYYVAGWITAISVAGLLLSAFKVSSPGSVAILIGFGSAAGTSVMGIYIILNGRKHLRDLDESIKWNLLLN
jgi:hypothetical protein